MNLVVVVVVGEGWWTILHTHLLFISPHSFSHSHVVVPLPVVVDIRVIFDTLPIFILIVITLTLFLHAIPFSSFYVVAALRSSCCCSLLRTRLDGPYPLHLPDPSYMSCPWMDVLYTHITLWSHSPLFPTLFCLAVFNLLLLCGSLYLPHCIVIVVLFLVIPLLPGIVLHLFVAPSRYCCIVDPSRYLRPHVVFPLHYIWYLRCIPPPSHTFLSGREAPFIHILFILYHHSLFCIPLTPPAHPHHTYIWPLSDIVVCPVVCDPVLCVGWWWLNLVVERGDGTHTLILHSPHLFPGPSIPLSLHCWSFVWCCSTPPLTFVTFVYPSTSVFPLLWKGGGAVVGDVVICSVGRSTHGLPILFPFAPALTPFLHEPHIPYAWWAPSTWSHFITITFPSLPLTFVFMGIHTHPSLCTFITLLALESHTPLHSSLIICVHLLWKATFDPSFSLRRHGYYIQVMNKFIPIIYSLSTFLPLIVVLTLFVTFTFSFTYTFAPTPIHPFHIYYIVVVPHCYWPGRKTRTGGTVVTGGYLWWCPLLLCVIHSSLLSWPHSTTFTHIGHSIIPSRSVICIDPITPSCMMGGYNFIVLVQWVGILPLPSGRTNFKWRWWVIGGWCWNHVLHLHFTHCNPIYYIYCCDIPITYYPSHYSIDPLPSFSGICWFHILEPHSQVGDAPSHCVVLHFTIRFTFYLLPCSPCLCCCCCCCWRQTIYLFTFVVYSPSHSHLYIPLPIIRFDLLLSDHSYDVICVAIAGDTLRHQNLPHCYLHSITFIWWGVVSFGDPYRRITLGIYGTGLWPSLIPFSSRIFTIPTLLLLMERVSPLSYISPYICYFIYSIRWDSFRCCYFDFTI